MMRDKKSTGKVGRCGNVARSVWLLVLAAGCGGDPTGPKESSELLFLRQATEAPPLATSDTTVVATRGEGLDLRIFYQPEPGENSGDQFLELKLDQESLLQYPPGHPRAGQLFAAGDTIEISVTIEPVDLIVTLEPSGIVFDPVHPAELELRYVNSDPDFDDDGVDDPELEGEIDLWRQESLGDPWERVGTLTDQSLDRVRATLLTFSRYALAI